MHLPPKTIHRLQEKLRAIALNRLKRYKSRKALAHAIDGDWYMMIEEPVEHDLWRSFVKAQARYVLNLTCKDHSLAALHSTWRQAGNRLNAQLKLVWLQKN